MNRFFMLIILIAALSSIPAAAQDAPPRRIVAYYTSWAMYDRQYFVTDIPADKLTHINYAFANVNADYECILADAWSDTQFPYPGDPEDAELLGNFRALQNLKDEHPGLQTLISVGGWTWSARFSDVALTPESRAAFANSCVDFMLRYGFDGIDLDWEYPAGGGHPTNRTRPEDKENFILLLADLRAHLDEQGAADGRHYLLTIAAGASRSAYQPLDWSRIHPLLDWINVMTYDMAGGWSSVTGFNAPLYSSDGSSTPPEGTSVDTAMQDHLALGVPADKLVLGVPFYGHGWQGVPPQANGLHQPPGRDLPRGTWEPGSFDYDDIIENYLTAGYTRYWDETALVPWIYNPDTGIMISYDDPESLTAKANYVREHNLGGIMFWELSPDDDSASLLTAIHSTLNTP